jgi:cytochrome P450
MPNRRSRFLAWLDLHSGAVIRSANRKWKHVESVSGQYRIPRCEMIKTNPPIANPDHTWRHVVGDAGLGRNKLRAEMHGLGLPSGAPLPYERLGELALFEMAFKEAMRINPPVPGLPRTALRDFQFKGLDIPAGTRVAINTVFTHRMPEIWPEPLKFDPLRFMDAAVRARHKYAWVPFGGGAHMCLGLHFAYMQAKSFFYHLLTTTRISLAHGYIQRWQMWPIPKPRDGLPIRIERISGQAG